MTARADATGGENGRMTETFTQDRQETPPLGAHGI